MITAQEVSSTVGALNNRKRQPIPQSLRNSPSLYIFNIYQLKHVAYMGGMGTFHIPACEEGKEYSEPLEVKGDWFDEFDRGEGSLGWTYETGMDVAKGMLCIGNVTGADKTEWGCFISTSRTPKASDLAAAKAKLTLKMKEFLAAGDRLALGGEKGLAAIDPMHRRAAQFLKQHRDWASDEVAAMRDCHGCGAYVKPNLPRCPECKVAFDIVKCREFWPLEYPAPAQVK
jgi:hypothetical protein